VAIAHLRATIVGGATSAVAAAAYRHRATMFDASDDRVVSYAHKDDLAHEEIAIPDGAPQWVRDMLAGKTVAEGSEVLWTKVTDIETEADAQFARELEISLPKELERAEQILLSIGVEFSPRTGAQF
jgi:ATP-dependent exoDNAse (exonuclease V) alpha subunit